MLIFLTVIYNLVQPYWDTLKKDLAKGGVSSLTIIQSPNLVGHSIGILIIMLTGFFVIPTDPKFFLFWFAMIAIASISLTLHIRGLLNTKFFAAEILTKLGFITSSMAAILLIGESLSYLQVCALALGVIGICLFSWPRRLHDSSFVWDRGVFFIIVSIILSGFASVFYKMATFYTPNYISFLSGRFVGDLVGWTIIWLVVSLIFLRRNPFAELLRCIKNRSGLTMIFGVGISTLLSSWLIYKLPVTTFAMLGVLTVPAAYLFSRFKYKDILTPRMWLGAVFIVGSVGLFLL